jgi:PEP-CTERM motif
MRNAPLILVALSLCASVPAFAQDVCSGVAGNIVANCGFENGVYSSTLSGNTNAGVPNSWTPDAAFDLEPSFNHAAGGGYSGSYQLSIGNYDYQPVPTLSQGLTDVSGTTYSGSLFVDYGGGQGGDSAAYFDVLINGADVVAVNDTPANGFHEYTFSFVGTGSDVLALTGNTDPSEWYVDSIVIASSVASTPEPSSLLLLGTAAGPLMWLRRKLVKR